MSTLFYDVFSRGIWNVPFMSSAILFSGEWISKLDVMPSYYSSDFDSDMALSQWMRDNVNNNKLCVILIY